MQSLIDDKGPSYRAFKQLKNEEKHENNNLQDDSKPENLLSPPISNHENSFCSNNNLNNNENSVFSLFENINIGNVENSINDRRHINGLSSRNSIILRVQQHRGNNSSQSSNNYSSQPDYQQYSNNIQNVNQNQPQNQIVYPSNHVPSQMPKPPQPLPTNFNQNMNNPNQINYQSQPYLSNNYYYPSYQPPLNPPYSHDPNYGFNNTNPKFYNQPYPPGHNLILLDTINLILYITIQIIINITLT